MSGLTFRERFRIAAVSVDRGKRSTMAGMFGAPLLRWSVATPPAGQLLIVPQDLRTADPSFWHEVERGQFGLAGCIAILRGRSPFEIEAPNAAWARELHGFGWLRNLEAAHDDEAKQAACRLAAEWAIRYGAGRGVGAEPAVAARRLISWLSHGNLLLDGADAESYEAITSSLGRQLALLQTSWRDALDGYPRLLALIALNFACLALAGHERRLKDVEASLAAELAWQVLPDGGHISRNPALLVELMLDLLPLSQCFTARDKAQPPQLVEALARILPMLRFLRLGDGMLARFNGLSVPPAASLATVLAYYDSMAQPLTEARASGYARLACGDSAVVVDVGSPPPLSVACQAQAGCLSFEMSAGAQLLFVNGGMPGAAAGDWQPAARATASHNTLCLAEKSSSRLVAHRRIEKFMGAPPIRQPDRVDWHVEEVDGGVLLEASHDGYRRRFALIHSRRLYLSADGCRLEGRDRLDGLNQKVRLRKDLPLAIHFHLYPGVDCRIGDHANETELSLADGQRWRFTADGAALTVAESAYFAESAGPRRALQITLRTATFGEHEVNWAVERCAKEGTA